MYWRPQPWYKRRWVRLGGVGLIVIGVLLAAGLFLSRAEVTPIREILENPDQFNGKVVTIRGTAVWIVPIPLTRGAIIEVQDKTGAILCRFDIKPDGLQKGDTICVRGRVYKVLDIPLPKRNWRFTGIGEARLCPQDIFMPKLH